MPWLRQTREAATAARERWAARSARPPTACLAGLLVLIVLAAPGCVRRRMIVRSDPPGAMVYVDDQAIGVTPVATPFTYYGTRNFVLMRDGFETIDASRTIHPPWYELPPIDFIAENLWPFELRDERALDFQMLPKQSVSTEQLIRRADDLRTSAAQGHAAPLPSCATTNPVPPTQTLFPPPTYAEPIPAPTGQEY